MDTVERAATSRRDDLALWAGLAVCMAVGPMMLYTLTAISPLVIEALHLSPTQYGAVSGVVFGSAAISALLLSGPTGHFGARAVMVAVSLGSTVGLAVFALAQSFVWVLAAAVICGAAQALSNPATNRIVAAQPAGRRGALIGWKQSGVQMAQFAAGLLAPAAAAVAGWRWAVGAGIAVGIVGMATALAIRPVTDHAGSGVHPVGPATRSVRTLTAYTFFMGFGLQATNAWLPLFAHRELGFGVTSTGLIAAVIGLVGLVSRIWWARRSEARGSASLLALATGSAAGVAVALLGQVGGSWLVWAGAAVFGAAALASNAVTMVELVRTVPAASLAAATGLLVTGMYLGFAAGPVCFGLALDRAGFGVAWLLPLAAFAAAALIGLPSALPRQPHP
jgi:predicted MFS family arabinose efflux permease